MPRASRLQQQLDEWRADAGVALAAGSVRIDGAVVWHGVSAEPEHGGSAPSQRMFPIYSITKTFTAVCILRLDQSGVVGVDDSVSKWMPDVSLSEAVTLSHLLRHTSGLPDYGPLREYHEAVRSRPGFPWTDDEFLRATLTQGWRFEPGTGWSYSNIGYMLLRRVIERASGLTFREAVDRHVASPLGLAHTFVAETIDDWACCVPAESRELRIDGEAADVRSSYHPGWCAPGVAVSTADEVTMFYDRVFSGALLDRAHLGQMLQLTRVPGDHPPATTPSYGMGIMADPDGRLGAAYGHGGGGPGYSAFAWIVPRSPAGRLSVAVFCNGSHANTERAVHELCRVVA